MLQSSAAKDLLLSIRCTLKAHQALIILLVTDPQWQAYGIYRCDIQDDGSGRYLAGT